MAQKAEAVLPFSHTVRSQHLTFPRHQNNHSRQIQRQYNILILHFNGSLIFFLQKWNSSAIVASDVGKCQIPNIYVCAYVFICVCINVYTINIHPSNMKPLMGFASSFYSVFKLFLLAGKKIEAPKASSKRSQRKTMRRRMVVSRNTARQRFVWFVRIRIRTLSQFSILKPSLSKWLYLVVVVTAQNQKNLKHGGALQSWSRVTYIFCTFVSSQITQYCSFFAETK